MKIMLDAIQKAGSRILVFFVAILLQCSAVCIASNIQIHIDEQFVQLCKKVSYPSDDQKNGMVVFIDSLPLKFASGFFPPMTKYIGQEFIELVDTLIPESALELKRLNLLCAQLRTLKTMKTQNTFQYAKTSFELCLEYILADQDAIQSIAQGKSKMDQNALKNVFADKIPGNTKITDIISGVEKLLIKIYLKYIYGLKEYFGVLQYIYQGANFSMQLDSAIQRLNVLVSIAIGKNVVNFAEWEKEIIDRDTFARIKNEQSVLTKMDLLVNSSCCQVLREFTHTEDIILYVLYKSKRCISKFVLSYNDLCPLCRPKFQHQLGKLLPRNIEAVIKTV